jgi:hypothetical protein
MRGPLVEEQLGEKELRYCDERRKVMVVRQSVCSLDQTDSFLRLKQRHPQVARCFATVQELGWLKSFMSMTQRKD